MSQTKIPLLLDTTLFSAISVFMDERWTGKKRLSSSGEQIFNRTFLGPRQINGFRIFMKEVVDK